MAKTIAIDLNDVVRDFTRQFKTQYIKHIDPDFEIEDEDIITNDLSEVFPFDSVNDFNKFLHLDYPYEIFGRAEAVDKMLPYRLNDWIQNTLRDFDEEKIPNVMFVSPFESNLAIQSTMVFLSKLPSRVREIYFPIVSATIWDRCDILITANPKLLESKPEGKTSIKIQTTYNKDAESDYTFNSLMDVIQDADSTIINLIEEDDA